MNLSCKFNLLILSFFIVFPAIYTSNLTAAEKLVFTSVDGAYIQQISEAVVKAAYAKLGIEFETSWLPAKRALLMSSTGQSDGEVSRIGAVAIKYPDLVQVKVPVNFIEGVAVSKNKPLPINGWQSLLPYKIGVNRGTIFSVNGTRGMNVTFANSFASLFQMLDKERVDVVVAPKINALSSIVKLDLKNLVINEPPVTVLNQYHFLHKRHAELAKRIEAVLEEMKQSGEISRIREKYIADLKKGIVHKRL